MTIAGLIAHGLGGRTDLPLSVWMFAYGAAAAVVISFAALAVFWPEPRLEPAPALEGREEVYDRPGRPGAFIPAAVVRVIGLACFATVLGAATFGDEAATRNLAPVAIYVSFWVGMTIICALVGDIWNAGLNPYDTLGGAISPVEARPYRRGQWPAAAGLLAFVWLELVYPDGAEPRVLAIVIVVYTAVVLGGAAWWGRPWLRQGETFAAWFGLLGAMAILGRETGSGRRRLRLPLVGLASVEARPGTVALVLVALGSTGFDGLSRSTIWGDLVGARSASQAVPLNTLGLAWSIGLVSLVFLGALKVASTMTARSTTELANAFAPSLVPIAVAYAVAHYFSLLVLEGQALFALVSDPFDLGWDLLGTIDRSVDYTLVSPNTIGYVQVASIVCGHIGGVVLAHDRALALFPRRVATKSQFPLLFAMVAFTVGGLALLLGG